MMTDPPATTANMADRPQMPIQQHIQATLSVYQIMKVTTVQPKKRNIKMIIKK